MGARRRAGASRGRDWLEHTELGSAAVLLAVWLALFLGTSAAKPRFLGVDTMTALSYSVVGLLPICVGVAVVTISGGGLDLSGGVVSVAAGLLCASFLSDGWPTALVVVAVVGFGAAAGSLNGFMVAVVGLDPVVATLASSFVGFGVMELQSIVLSMPIESALRSFSLGRPLGVTNLLWICVAILLAAEGFLRRTRPGRHVVALGGNAVAATRFGISTRSIRFGSFVFSGTCAAVGGLMVAGSSDLVRADISNTHLFDAISAVLLAGIALGGGRGRLLTLLASVLVIVTIPASIATLGVASGWTIVIQGGVLGIALAFDGLRARRSAAR